MGKLVESKSTGIETILDGQELKDYSVKNHKQEIKLLNVEQTRSFLKKLVKEYKDIEVTRENYKDTPVEAERRLRQSRHALNNIHKSNKKVLNDAKNAEKKVVENLVAIIQPLEKELYEKISAIKQTIAEEKAEEERKEVERKAKIQKGISDTELDLEKRVNTTKESEGLKEYDSILEELKGKFEEFDEFEFEVKRIHAVYTGRRAEIVNRIDQIAKDKIAAEEKAIKDKAEAEAKAKKDKEEAEQKAKDAKLKAEEEKKREEMSEKIFDLRKQLMIGKGFEVNEGIKAFTYTGVPNVLFCHVKNYDELEWFENSSKFDTQIEQSKQAKDKADKDAIKEVKSIWDGLITKFSELGGSVKEWKLKKGEFPTVEKVGELQSAMEVLKTKRAVLKKKAIKAEIDPFKDEILEFFNKLEKKVKATKFKEDSSLYIMDGFIEGVANLASDIFGEIMDVEEK